MARAVLILIAFMTALSVPLGNSGRTQPAKSQQPTGARPATPQDGAIQVSIATARNLLGVPQDRHKVGDQILVTITMTNTSTEPRSACISSDLYQNLPRLTKDGQALPYLKWQSYERLNTQHNHTCEEVNLPETIVLRPKEPVVADWFLLVHDSSLTGADAWYDSLLPGRYELTIQRRFACCHGPMVESNKITFEVVP